MENLEKMDKFLEKLNLPRLNQKEIKNMNRSVTSNKIKTVIKNLPTNKNSRPGGSTGKFFQTFREAAAKSLQSCLTTCDPIDGSPPGSSV